MKTQLRYLYDGLTDTYRTDGFSGTVYVVLELGDIAFSYRKYCNITTVSIGDCIDSSIRVFDLLQ